MACDVLSDVLRNVRLRGAVYYHVGGDTAWAAEAPAARDIAAVVMPGVEHVMEYHVSELFFILSSFLIKMPCRKIDYFRKICNGTNANIKLYKSFIDQFL